MSCLFVEQLTVIDCAYLDSQRGLVGQSWIVDLELEGALDRQSMVLDFGEVKKRLKRGIDRSVDHSLLVPQQAAGLSVARTGEELALTFETPLGRYEHRSPATAVSLVDAPGIDAASVTAYLVPRLQPLLPANVSALRLHLREERIDGASYRYVHGLKKHQGACQRIAHGHRSRLELRVDGIRNRALEEVFARAWQDIYLGTRADIVERSNGYLRFRYTAQEGHYELALPENRCDLLDSDTTVECIAAQLLERLSGELPQQRLEVRAYEGVMKGAIARTPP